METLITQDLQVIMEVRETMDELLRDVDTTGMPDRMKNAFKKTQTINLNLLYTDVTMLT